MRNGVVMRFVLLGIVCVFFLVLLYGVRNQSHSWYFQDEGEHTILGWMQQRFDRVLYQDLSTNHQPLPIFAGQFLTTHIPYDSFFQFVYRLRVSLWLYAFLSVLILVYRFGLRGLSVSLLTYSAAHYFFGWHLLAESLVIPPVLWMLLALREKHQTFIDAAYFGLALFIIAFSLLPLWPFLAVSCLFYIYTFGWKTSQFMLLSFLSGCVILFTQIHPYGWYVETIQNNLYYFIPYEATKDSLHYVRLLLYPIFNTHLWYSVPFLLGLILVFVKRREKRSTILIYLLLSFLLNPRTSEVNAQFYGGFHLFPYIAGIGFLSFYAAQELHALATTHKVRYGALSMAVYMCVVVCLNLAWVFEKRSRMQDYFIAYDTFQAYGSALKTLALPGDTLLTGPNGAGYMNFVADVPLAGLQHFHLEWAYRVPELRQKWLELIQTHPPTFIYFELGNDPYSAILRPLMKEKYIVLKRKGGGETLLFMRTDALPKISEDQWKRFEEQAFERVRIQP